MASRAALMLCLMSALLALAGWCTGGARGGQGYGGWGGGTGGSLKLKASEGVVRCF